MRKKGGGGGEIAHAHTRTSTLSSLGGDLGGICSHQKHFILFGCIARLDTKQVPHAVQMDSYKTHTQTELVIKFGRVARSNIFLLVYPHVLEILNHH